MVGAPRIEAAIPESIAIIGIGCRYPQADGPEELWRLMMRSGDGITDYAEHRFAQLDYFYEAARKKSAQARVYRGGFLHSVDRFDPQLFEMSPREAMYMDPQHRLLLEVAYEALEDAGQTSDMYRGSRTAVFTGLWTSDFESHLYQYGEGLDFYVMTGGGRAQASGRLSFTFGLEGPSLNIDAACSSSLVAIHLACRSLQSHETNMALAGGANIILSSNATELFAQAGMLSREGHCKFGDSTADGFVRSEGAAIVVLKRLSDAVASRDPIYGVIRGSAVNNDGRTNGLMMTPSVEGQRNLLLQAWRSSGIDPHRLRYLEAHGTGTSAGDPVEIEAFGTALVAAGVTGQECYMGSIKSNIGHTESAAGVAGVIKVAMGMRRGVIPPSLHFNDPTPKVDWASLPVRVLTEPLELPAFGDELLAGVSSFGLTGTNAHVIVAPFPVVSIPTVPPIVPVLFATSAHTTEALDARLKDMVGVLRDGTNAHTLVDICYTSSARRTLHEYRFAAVAESKEELAEKIYAHLAQIPVEGVAVGRRPAGLRKVVFIAPGQGSQSVGMASELLRIEPVFRDSLERCSAAIQAETGWSLMDRAFGDGAEEFLSQIDVVQPALFAVSVALAELWRSRGVEPSAVVGHSMGEVAAAHIAGILSLEDAVAVICRRSRLMKTIGGSGAMATVELPAEEMLAYTEPSQGRISIGACNSPATTVISGDPEAIDDLLNLLELKDIFCRRIKVDVASHSSQVDPILLALVEELSELRPAPATIPLLSTVTGKFIAGEEMNAEYWRRNLRQAVLFAPAIEALARDGHDCFIELSPHPVLLPALESTLRAAHPSAVAVASLRRGQPDRSNLLLAMGTLFIAGYPVDWSSLFPDSARCVELPVYPYQRESYWPDAAALERKRGPLQRKNPLIGEGLQSSLHASAIFFNVELDLARLPYLLDHRVRDMVVVPASAQIECALEAARSLNAEGPFDVCDLALINALTLSEAAATEVQLTLIPIDGQRFSFEISSRGAGAGAGSVWTIHSTGKLQPRAMVGDVSALADISLRSDPQADHCSADQHYLNMAEGGIQYGPAFRLWAEGWINGDSSLSRVENPPQSDDSASGYVLHPAVLDACFQSISDIGPLAAGYLTEDTYLPVAMERLTIHRPLSVEGELFVQCHLASGKQAEGRLAIDLRVADASGNVLFEVSRLEAQRVHKQASADVSDLLFNLEWVPEPALIAGDASKDASNQHWVLFSDSTSETSHSCAESLAGLVTSRGGSCTLVNAALDAGADIVFEPTPSAAQTHWVAIDARNADHLDELFSQNGRPVTAVIHISRPDSMADESSLADEFFRAQTAGVELLPRIVQSLLRAELSPRLWMVTCGAMTIDDSITAPSLNSSTIWGMGTVIAREHPELRACVVDLSSAPDSDELRLLGQSIFGIESNESNDRVALRGQSRYVPRFARFSAKLAAPIARPLHSGEEYRAIIANPGILDEIGLQAVPRNDPARCEVAIEILATSLNFIDVLKAMGVYPGMDPAAPLMLGMECAGRIVSLGEGVTEWHVGDEVVAIAPNAETGLFGSYAVVPADLIAAKPNRLSMEEAAALPLAYITAYLSMVKLAQIAEGEWVLVHSGAGGVGLASIEIALRAGAHVIATASTPEKHSYLKSLGVAHVFDSRSLDFGKQVIDVTAGRGVDIVINSLTGEAITKSMEALAPYGRFIELGKRDIYEDRRIGLKAFRRNISYHVVDVAAIVVERRSYFTSLLRHVMEQVSQGHWRPLPVNHFSASEPAEPFRHMASGRHIGKVVIAIHRDVEVLPPADQHLFLKDATYLITGGLGGVGSAVAEWMVKHGARHLVIVSRRAPSVETEAILDRIRGGVATVLHSSVDIANSERVSALIDHIHHELPPLRGIMHAAASIDDVLIRDLTPERYAHGIDAKVRGAINLHECTRHDDLDFCILFSSIAAIYPQPGVGSYAAANLFLDSFARYRRALGLAATSVNWGGWENTGLAREAGTSRSISGYHEQGVSTFTLAEGLECLRAALQFHPVQLLTFRIETAAFVAFHEQTGIPPLFAQLTQNALDGRSGVAALPEIQAHLASATSEKQTLEILEAYLQQQLGKVLRLSADRIDSDRPFGAIGLDSLMGLEFVRRLNAGLGITLSATVVFNYPTIRQLARHVAARLQANPVAQTHSEAVAPVVGVGSSVNEQTAVDADLSEEQALEALMRSDFDVVGDSSARGRA